MNAYIRILKAQPSINGREDGYAYLETTYNANMICGDTIASLRNNEEGNFRLYRDMVFFPLNIKDCHWYLAVINGRKGVIQKDMTNFRLKLAVTLVNYAWNKVKGSPGYKASNADETYTLEDNEK
ncbi:hypothetical protein SETIT_4G157100v2 [Setaria italica]|uniref:Ubiquitin-like protease family profile domain-containing protein n=1 Tax=Setaria italica TaxID=4555 RepID=A0A368QV40_SETIT|nr:hypothetical protein SETIT_4G157100v2 [Setaria italica]